MSFNSKSKSLKFSKSLFNFRRSSKVHSLSSSASFKKEQKREIASTETSNKESEIDEALQALRKQKNEELANRDNEIKELKKENKSIDELLQKLKRDLKDQDDGNKNIEQTTEIKAIIKELQFKDEQIAELKQQISETESKAQISEIHTEDKEIETENETEHEMESYKQMIENDQNVDRLSMTLQEKNKVIKEQEELLAKQEEKIYILKEKKAAIRRTSKTDKATIERLSRAIADKVVKLSDYDMLRDELLEKEKQINDLKEDNISKRQQFDEMQMEMNVVYERCTNLEKKAVDYEQEMERLKNEIAEYEMHKPTLSLRASAAQQYLSSQSDKELIEKLIEQIAENEAELEKYKKKVKKRDSKINVLKAKEAEIQRRSTLDKETIGNLWAEMGEKVQQYDELKEQFKERDKEIDDMKKKMNVHVLAPALGAGKKNETLNGGLGSIFITTRTYQLKTACNQYLNRLSKKIKAMNGFKDGIWEKKRFVSRNNACGKIRFSFNYLGDDIMKYKGVKELANMLRNDGNVQNVKIEDQKYLN